MERRLPVARQGERGTHPVLIAVAAVIVLIIAVVIFLLLQKPKQVTPVAVIGTSPSASAAATPTAVPVTVAPTVAPTPKPVSTSPAFARLSVPHKVACDGQAVIYPPMSWSAVNATGITISIDNPDGILGSYGPSGSSGPDNQIVDFACSTTPLVHRYYFTTTGGTGPAVTKEVTITGTP